MDTKLLTPNTIGELNWFLLVEVHPVDDEIRGGDLWYRIASMTLTLRLRLINLESFSLVQNPLLKSTCTNRTPQFFLYLKTPTFSSNFKKNIKICIDLTPNPTVFLEKTSRKWQNFPRVAPFDPSMIWQIEENGASWQQSVIMSMMRMLIIMMIVIIFMWLAFVKMMYWMDYCCRFAYF